MERSALISIKRITTLIVSMIAVFVICAILAGADAFAAEKPAQVTGVKWVSGYQSVKLSWNAVIGSGIMYEVREGDTVKATGLKTTSTEIKFDPYPAGKDGVAKTATYDIYAYTGSGSNKIYSDKATIANVQPVHPMYVVAKTRRAAKLYKSKGSNKAAAKVKKGTVLVSYGGSRIKGENKRLIVKYNGKTYYVKSRDVKITKMRYNSKTKYSKETIESFINDKGLKSKPVKGPKRLIWVNTYNQRVYLFSNSGGKWVIDKRYPNGLKANTGKELTPYGVFKISSKWDRKPVTGTRWWCIFNAVGIHQKLGDKLGKPASGGCVRIPTNDAKWFYYNIKKRTTVFVY